MEKYSFIKGYEQVQKKDLKVVESDIMKVLRIKNRVSWNSRLKGEIEPKISEHQAIEKIFNERGITEIWGE